ncbi:DUF4365 domain-containing protein [Bailinhaonella thermotolerans]|uniref:DUF4365 domain-containing protein n=1 Tax=Bailinhaonella thermotolerans TaxID=1070861 RepID=A0A3A4AXQ1_9ACTN|nr:DUF4365 domain-containing protein [Bailinhaonella thermotolerans]RJL33189.1 DUF4365 domain-containing protein [Bailinhaonella thermotolerans]
MVFPAREHEQNALQGDFGEAWIEAVAAGCGILHGKPATLDLQKADVQLSLRGHHAGTYNPTVLVQVKTTTDLRRVGDVYHFDLDVETYEVLRRDDHSIRRILAVIGMPKDGEYVRLVDDGTLLVGCGAWVSLEGLPATTNGKTQVVRLPAANTLDPDGLRRMLEKHGVRRSTPVPLVDAWEIA